MQSPGSKYVVLEGKKNLNFAKNQEKHVLLKKTTDNESATY